MGVMIEGVWHSDEPASGSADDGKYCRSVSSFRNWITPDGAPGPKGEGGFAAENLGVTTSILRWAARGRTAR